MTNKTLFSILIIGILSSCMQKDQPNKSNLDSGHQWWKDAIVYQIYPRSFKDTDGDGVGDIKGIIEKLDYLKKLGINAVWLNPIYESPNDDNGYDVSDYKSILGEFGTIEDFDIMLKGMHDRGIKLIMDIVVNHSSDEHEWFKQSRSSRDNAYRDYYHWWPAEKGKPNYRYSLFDEKGDAWKFDSLTNAYYLHYFSQKQPDLNWSNPKVRKEVIGILKFWAEKGVDGFRLDAFQFAAKDTTYPAFPDGFENHFIDYYAMQDGLHDYLMEMNREVFSKYNVMSVAEGAGRNFKEAHELVDEDRNELNMAYAFDGVDLAKYEGYDFQKFKNTFTKWDSAFQEKGWISIFLANHDQARLVSRFGNDTPQFKDVSSKMLNTFILSMKGTPYCYYGDEIAMTNMDFKDITEYKDIAAINGYKKALAQQQDMDMFMKKLNFESRDNGRTPMQWDNTSLAGFTLGKPWIPVNPNNVSVNVAAQEVDPQSVLNYFIKMVKLRKENPILVHGKYEILERNHPSIYAYTRTLENNTWVILLNFTKEKAIIDLPNFTKYDQIKINNYTSLDRLDNQITLLPYQAVILSQKI